MSINRRSLVLISVTLTLAASSPRPAARAGEPAASKIPAKDPLHRYVGSWRGEVTVEAGTGKPTTYTQENRFAWTLGGAFLEERGSGSNGTSFAGLWTLDAKAGASNYLAHYFLAPTGEVVVLHHEWVEAKQSFVGTADLGGGVRMVLEDHFLGPDAYEWSITVQDPQGSVLSRTRGRERRVRH
jgi:hypothetical protein